MTSRLAALTPSIESISPQKVSLGWEGIVKIHGKGFDSGSFVKFNDATPKVIDKSETLLAVEIHPDLTANPGRHTVVVHNTEGGVTNQVEFIIS